MSTVLAPQAVTNTNTDLEEIRMRIVQINQELNTSLSDLQAFISRTTGAGAEDVTDAEQPVGPGTLAGVNYQIDAYNVCTQSIRKCILAIEKIG